MVLYVPTQPVPSQTLQSNLGGQACTLNVFQQAYGMYMDVLIGTNPIVQGILCLNANLIIRNTYFGFIGDFIFLDTQGSSDPVYTGLNSRWFLTYLEATDIAALGFPTGVA